MAICIWNVAPSSSAKWNCLSNVTVASSRLLTLPRILVWVVECKCAWQRLIIDFFSEQFRNDGLQKAWAWTVLTSLCLHFNSDFFSFPQGFSTAGKGNCCHALMGGKVNVVVFLVYKCSCFYAWSPWLTWSISTASWHQLLLFCSTPFWSCCFCYKDVEHSGVIRFLDVDAFLMCFIEIENQSHS